MAKELPYFKFEPAEYLTKNISFCSLSAQGLFVNVCSYYWQRNCKLTKEQVLRRLNYETELNELITEGIIDLKDEFIVIKFLDNQLKEVEEKSKTNSKNGKLGGRPKKPKESEQKPNAFNSLSETKGIREDKIILDDKPIIIDEKEFEHFKEKYKLYATELYQDDLWVEAVSMNKIKHSNNEVNKKTIHKYLKLFLNHLDETQEKHHNKKDFQYHFSNWLRKQTIEFATVKQKPLRYF